MSANTKRRSRAGTGVGGFALEKVGDGFGNKPTGFASDVKRMATNGINIDSLHPEEIVSEAMIIDHGENESSTGLVFPQGSFSFPAEMRGLGGSGAGDGETPELTAQAILMAGALGGTPAHVDGDTVKTATSPSTTVIENTTAVHTDATGVAAYLVGGKVEVRPIASLDGDEVTLAMALSAAPAAESVTPGLTIVHYSEEHLESVYAEIIGKKAGENFEAGGLVFDFDIPEQAVNQVPLINWTAKVATLIEDIVRSQVAPPTHPPVPSGREGTLLIAKYGNTAGLPLAPGRPSFQPGNEWQPSENFNANGIGIEGWTKFPGRSRWNSVVPIDGALPTGCTASTWRENFDLGGSENRFHILCQWGNQMGGGCGIYLRDVFQAVRPKRAGVDGKSMQRLMFGFRTGSDTPPITYFEF